MVHFQEEKTRDRAVQLLLRKGATVNLRDEVGRTALSYACEMRCNDIVRILVKNNVNPDLADILGIVLHLFIQAISIALLQVRYYSEALPT